jgi:enoyl-CoA hydratase/carnithine racemase
MDHKFRGIVVFVGATLGAAALHQVASRQSAKLGIPHVAVGLVAAVIAHES